MMAKQATSTGTASSGRKTASKPRSKPSTAVARRSSPSKDDDKAAADGVGEAFIKLLQSPLAAELVAVAATAALAALAEHGFSSAGNGRGKRAGKEVKEAGKAAAAAVGRRLTTEFEEIRKAATDSKGGAAA
jgi:hypothetical protein